MTDDARLCALAHAAALLRLTHARLTDPDPSGCQTAACRRAADHRLADRIADCLTQIKESLS